MVSPTLEQVREEITQFSNRKFGEDRPYTAPLHHLIGEAKEAIVKPELSEYADMLLCLLDSFRIKFPFYHTNDLLNAAIEKIIAMEPRVWSQPDENGCLQHTMSIEEPGLNLFTVDTEEWIKLVATKKAELSNEQKAAIEKVYGKIINISSGTVRSHDYVIIV